MARKARPRKRPKQATTKRTSRAVSPGVISTNEIYTIEELNRRFGISVAGVRAARDKGLTVLRFGRKKVVRGIDVMRYLDSME